MTVVSMGGANGVFINCPFDPAFEELFDAIFFTVVASGFQPRSSLEGGMQADLRLERIMRALNGSRYSIHDLSRAGGEGPNNLARFNMPLELGMAMQLRRSQLELKLDEPHDLFVMTGAQSDYERFASDLKGFDIRSHGETTEGVVSLLVEWLQAKRGAASHATKPLIAAALPHYREAKRRARQDFGEVWSRFVSAAADVAEAQLRTG